jgi:multisubunit Na+/H+ antiporter MnhE subunit
MKYSLAVLRLALNFLKSALLSGLDTARLILRNPRFAHSGLTRMPYGDLGDTSASILGALVTLTPGTTVLEIDLQQKEFVIHLLDLDKREAVVTAIQHDFIAPMQILERRRV